jgi:hypothetical protein
MTQTWRHDYVIGVIIADALGYIAPMLSAASL